MSTATEDTTMPSVDDRVAEWVVDQQSQSPLFDRLPFEIRSVIFKYALIPYCPNPIDHYFRLRLDHADPDADGVMAESVRSAEFTDSDCSDDPDSIENDDESDGGSDLGAGGDQTEAVEPEGPFSSCKFDREDSDDGDFDPDVNILNLSPALGEPMPGYLLRQWLRPDCLGFEKVNMALLRTCRRVYIEARGENFMAHYDLRVWNGLNPRQSGSSRGSDTIFHHPIKLTIAHKNLMVSARVFTCTHDFGDLVTMCEDYRLKRIQHLRITIRHLASVMGADPYRTIGTHSRDVDMMRAMSRNMDSTADFGHGPLPEESPDADWQPPVLWRQGGWANMFRFIPRLQSLTMDFDAHEHNRVDVGKRAEWAARVWRFPLWTPRPDGCTYLAAKAGDIQLSSWRGVPDHFPLHCPFCRKNLRVSNPDVCTCSYTTKRMQLLDRGVGPRMYTFTVKWTPRIGKPWVAPFPEPDWVPDGRDKSGRLGPGRGSVSSQRSQ